jgi:hypothetical protein
VFTAKAGSIPTSAWPALAEQYPGPVPMTSSHRAVRRWPVDRQQERDDGSAQLRANVGGRRAFNRRQRCGNRSTMSRVIWRVSWGNHAPACRHGRRRRQRRRDQCPARPPAPPDSSGLPAAAGRRFYAASTTTATSPGTPPAKVDAVGCEVDGDDDADGILNSVDQCPNSPPGTRVNNVGRPSDGALLLQSAKSDQQR